MKEKKEKSLLDNDTCKPRIPIYLRKLKDFDFDFYEIRPGRPQTRKLHPKRGAKPGRVTLQRIVLVNALIRNGKSLIEASEILNINKTTARNRYYGLADHSTRVDDKGYFRMHVGAFCALDFEVDSEKLTFPDIDPEGRNLAKKEKKKKKTLRELLYNK